MSKKAWDFPYNVRYEVFDSHIIYNFVGRKLTKEYCEKINEKKNNFFTKLERDVLQNGFLNPICVAAGWGHDIDAKPHQKYIRSFLPEHMQEDDSKILMCDRNGGSRLYIAQKYNLKVPCIITDYVNRFPNSETLNNVEDIMKKFTHPPKHIKFDSRGILVLIPHQLD